MPADIRFTSSGNSNKPSNFRAVQKWKRQRPAKAVLSLSCCIEDFFSSCFKYLESGLPAKYLIVSSLCASSMVLRPATSVSIFLSVWVRARSCWACFKTKRFRGLGALVLSALPLARVPAWLVWAQGALGRYQSSVITHVRPLLGATKKTPLVQGVPTDPKALSGNGWSPA